MRTTLLVAMLLAAITTSLAGCNTVQGVGRDTEKAGEKIQDTAEKNK